jgi:hypothetical protein
MRRTLLPTALLATALTLAVTGAAGACTFSATLRTPGHHPKADKPWPVRITLNKRLKTYVTYDFYFRGRHVDKTHYPFYNHNYPFDSGSFIDRTFTWPKRSIGIPLVVKFGLRNRCGRKSIAYSVKVVR